MPRMIIKKKTKATIQTVLAVVYLRVSTEEQSKHRVSLEAQEALLRAYCERSGLQVAAVFVERGVSAGIDLADRPEGKKLVEAVRSGQVSHIVAKSLDRLFRSAINALEFAEEWRQGSANLHLVEQGIDTRTPAGLLMYGVSAQFAQMEREMIGQRVSVALQHKKSTGRVYGHTPMGKRREFVAISEDKVDKFLHDDPESQAAIRRMVHLRYVQGLRLQRICDLLEAEGVRTSRGGKWWPASVKWVLENHSIALEEYGLLEEAEAAERLAA